MDRFEESNARSACPAAAVTRARDAAAPARRGEDAAPPLVQMVSAVNIRDALMEKGPEHDDGGACLPVQLHGLGWYGATRALWSCARAFIVSWSRMPTARLYLGR